jgi:TolA-binding protein
MESASPGAVGRAAAFAVVLSSVAWSAEPDPAATRDYATAAGLQNRRLYAEAAARWRKFLETHPGDPRADKVHQHLGTCLLQDGKPADAAAVLRTLLSKYPAFAAADAARFNLGLSLFQIAGESKKPDDHKAAAAAFADCVAKHPASRHAPAALYYQAESVWSAGDPSAAAGLYRKLADGYPQSELVASALYGLGTARQELGQDDKAEAAFQEFLRRFPQDPQADECRLRLGLSLAAQKKPAEAAAVLGQAAGAANFGLADFALLRQAQAVYEQGRFAEAAALYRSLPTKHPKSSHVAAALLAAGKCLYLAADLPAAQVVLADVAARGAAESPEAAVWLSRTLLKSGKPAEALAAADRVIPAAAKSPVLPELELARIDAIAEMPDRRAEAVRLYADYASRRADHELSPRAVYLAALTALRVGDHAAGAAHAGKFLADAKLAKHPLTAEVLFLAAEAAVLPAEPDPAKAEPLYRRLLAEFPAHPQTVTAKLRIGLCLHAAKKYDAAAAHLRTVQPELKDPAQAAEGRLLTGLSDAAAGRHAPAVAVLQSALQAKPDWDRGDEVLTALAGSLRAEKKDADAAAALGKLLDAFPKSRFAADALYQLGEIAYAAGKPADAEARYAAVAERFPQSELAAPALYGVGCCRFAQGAFDKAAETLTQLLAAHGRHAIAPRARYVRGLALYRLGRFDPAAADLAAYVAERPAEPEAVEARFVLGLCQAGAKKFDAAAATLSALAAEKPDWPAADKVLYELAFAQTGLGKTDDAAATFRKLATARPDSLLAGEAWFRVGEHHEAAKRLPEAAAAYEAGLKTAKAAAELREKLAYKLGWVRFSTDKFPEAAAVLLEQLKEHPRGALAVDAAFLAGESLFKAGKWAEALPPLNEAIRSRSEKYLARALYRAGTCATNLKQWDAAAGHYGELLRAAPKFELIAEAKCGLAFALQNQGRLDDAASLYAEVTGVTGTETAAKARFMIGEIAFGRKQYKQAVEHFLETALGYPYPEWQALGHFEAARCLIELKDAARAIAELETVVRKYPDHPSAKDAARLIASLKK